MINLKQDLTISHDKERFLIINGILHGRKVGEDIYDFTSQDDLIKHLEYLGGVDNKSNSIALYVKEINKLVDRDFKKDLEKYMPNETKSAICNFFRTGQYDLIELGQDNITTASMLKQALAEKKINQNVVEKIIQLLFQNLVYDENVETPCFKDGELIQNSPEKQVIVKSIIDGFNMSIGKGICSTKLLDTLKECLSLINYKRITPAKFTNILSGLSKLKMNPFVLLNTVLSVPDYIDTFDKYGVVAEISPVDKNIIMLLIDNEDGEHASVWEQSISTFTSSNTMNSLRNLRMTKNGGISMS